MIGLGGLQQQLRRRRSLISRSLPLSLNPFAQPLLLLCRPECNFCCDAKKSFEEEEEEDEEEGAGIGRGKGERRAGLAGMRANWLGADSIKEEGRGEHA